MVTIPVHEPLWRATYDNVEHYGEGTLKEVWKVEPRIDSFQVKGKGFLVTVRPRMGEILTDSSIVLKTSPGKLVWFAQMQIRSHSHDTNKLNAPRLNFWGVGIEINGVRHGLKLYDDGKIEIGL